MAADDGPRETILRDMKYERIARSIGYDLVERAVARFLASPTRDQRILDDCATVLEAKRIEATNPRRRDNLTYALRALETFMRSLNALAISGLRLSAVPPFTRQPMVVEGVNINVKPSVNIRVARPRGIDLVGACIIDLAKGSSAKTDVAQAKLTSAMEHTAALIHQRVSMIAREGEEKASPDHCVVFHVYRSERVCAAATYKIKLRNIRAVCRVIARGWDSIAPPPSFDQSCATYRD